MSDVKEIYTGQFTKGAIGYCSSGDWKGWIFWKHPDGQWVSIAQIPEKAPTNEGDVCLVDNLDGVKNPIDPDETYYTQKQITNVIQALSAKDKEIADKDAEIAELLHEINCCVNDVQQFTNELSDIGEYSWGDEILDSIKSLGDKALQLSTPDQIKEKPHPLAGTANDGL